MGFPSGRFELCALGFRVSFASNSEIRLSDLACRPRRQVVKEVPNDEHPKVDLGAIAFMQVVIAVGIDEIVEAFAQFDQAIHQPFGDFDVRVGFARAGDHQQVAAQAIGVSRRSP